MSNFFEIVRLLVVCGTLLCGAFLVLLAMPNSKLRQVLMPVFGWAFAAFCAFYAISPIDLAPEALLGPFGLIDDVGAVIAGIAAAKAASSKNE